jgi:hypothetical protein
MREDAQWCTQCFATVEAAFDPLTAPLDEVEAPEPVAVSVAVEPADPTPPPSSTAVEHRPRHARHARPAGDPLTDPLEPAGHAATTGTEQDGDSANAESSDPLADTDVDLMLTLLAADHRSKEQASALAQYLSDRGTRVIATIIGVSVVAIIGFILLFILSVIT